MISVAAVVLAAGRGQRFGGDRHDSKLVASFHGQPLVRHTVSSLVVSRADPVIVVLGHAAAVVESALAGLPVELVPNLEHETGLAGSLRAGLAAVPSRAEGVIVMLGDMPLVSHETIDRLVDRFEKDPREIDAVVPRCEGRNGNPVLIGRRLFADLARLEGDEGARKLLSGGDRRVVFCEVEDPGIALDVDTPGALEALMRART